MLQLTDLLIRRSQVRGLVGQPTSDQNLIGGPCHEASRRLGASECLTSLTPPFARVATGTETPEIQ